LADDACDVDDMVLALSDTIDGDGSEDPGEAIDCVTTEVNGRIGCIGS
jgi:hypothetical protein